jgi:hypothetical protein
MSIFAMLLVAQAALSHDGLPDCQARQLRLSVDGKDGDFNGMSHSGTELSIRNLGPDCRLAALPEVVFRDRHGRRLPAIREVPVGMHPGPVMVPLRLAAGHRAVTDLRWVAGPVFPQNRALRSATITVRIGGTTIRAPLTATLYGNAGKPVTFDQPPLQAAEGMVAH